MGDPIALILTSKALGLVSGTTLLQDKRQLTSMSFFFSHRQISPRTVEKNAHRICILLTLPTPLGHDWALSPRLPLCWKISIQLYPCIDSIAVISTCSPDLSVLKLVK